MKNGLQKTVNMEAGDNQTHIRKSQLIDYIGPYRLVEEKQNQVEQEMKLEKAKMIKQCEMSAEENTRYNFSYVALL